MNSKKSFTTLKQKKQRISIISFALLLFLSFNSFGRNFYFSNSIGNDTRTSTQAQNPSTPWKSIARLNSYFPSLLPGDSILFRRGEVFYGTIVVTKSGTSTQPIILGAYGTGSKPVISGFSTLTGWTSLGSGIYQASASACKSSLNMVTLNGVQKGIGRYPNTGYLTFENHVGTTSITDNELTGTPNWTGAEVVIRKNRWVIDRNPITSHSGNTITYVSASTYPGVNGYGYFIQKDPKTLDLLGEWYFDNSTKNLRMFFGSNNPATYTVKASSLDTLLSIDEYNYININNLSFQGANVTPILVNTSDNIKITYCEILYSGDDGIKVTGGSDNLLIDNNIIRTVNNNGIEIAVWENVSSNATITNNTIGNIGTIPGMTGNGDGSSTAITSMCANSLIQYNKVDTVGYIGITANRNYSVIKNNSINYFCTIKEDGAGIYAYQPTYRTQLGQSIENNIISNGLGNHEGIPASVYWIAHGIYMDGCSQSILISNNTVSNCAGGGYFFGWYAKSIQVTNNTGYNNAYQIWSQRSNPADLPNYNIQNNIFVARELTQQVWFVTGTYPNNLGTIDNNYYCRPLNDNNSLYLSATPQYIYMSLPQWRTTYNKDLNTNVSPLTITNVNDILFETNPTNSNKTITLTAPYVSMNNTVYTGSVTLAPYTSIVLIKNSNANLPPVIANQTFQANANSANGTTVGTVIASDPNAGQTISYSIQSGNTNSAFSINSSTGVLTVANSTALNFQTTPTFSLVVRAADNATPSLYSQATITVNLTNTSTCSATGNISYQVWNNIGAGTAVSILTSNANYPNNPSSTTLITSMEATTNLGELFGARIAGYICAPATGNYTFWIASDDNGELWLSTNNLPANKQRIAYHTANTGSRQWNTYATQKSAVISLVQGQTYYIEALMKENTGGDNLAVGWLKPGQTGTVPSEVIPGSVLSPLSSVNSAPVILNQSFQLNENSSNGTSVGTVVASDPNSGQTLTYSILSGNTNNAFSINSSTGVLTVATSGALNFESTPTFSLVVRVQDNGSPSLNNQATITVSLININETPSINAQSFSVAENALVGTSVGTVSATDPDAGQVLSYSILSGNTNSAFTINSSTGQISVLTPSALNFEATPFFTLSVRVSDNGSPSLNNQANVIISLLNVNEVPVMANQSFTAMANSANNSSIGVVVASDPDAGQILTYSIVSGNTGNAFSINSSSGTISVANSAALSLLTNPVFNLVVKADDNGASPLSAQATVTITLLNPNACTATGNISYQVWNNIGGGTAVSVLTSNVNYPNNPTTTTLITSMEGTTNLAELFGSRIAGYICAPATGNYTFWIASDDNGELWLSTNDLPANKQRIAYHTANTGSRQWNNYVTQKSAPIYLVQGETYYIEALMKENTGGDNIAVGWLKPGQTGTVPSEVIPGSVLSPLGTNTNLPPIIANQSFSIAENSVSSTSVGTVVASDPNSGQVITYSIVSGNTNGTFSINTTNGLLTVANSAALNFETNPTFNLVISVQDNGSTIMSSQATITVSLTNVNEIPTIAAQSFTITENAAINTVVGTVLSSDPDAGQIRTYTILSGNTNGAFAINSLSGAITVANVSALNFELNPNFVLAVSVQDNGTPVLSSQANVTISLTNVNEVPFINAQSLSIAENSANGSTIGSVSATDPDAGQTLTFSILSGNTNGAFSIGSSTGLLSVANSSALNFETTPSFSLVVSVQDNGSPVQNNQATVTVSLLNVNELPIVANQDFSVLANSPNSTVVGTLLASDPDQGQALTYTILSGNTSTAFSIGSSTGIITVANSAALNMVSNPIFSLVVEVKDNGSVNLSSQASVSIVLVNPDPCTATGNISYQVWNNIGSGTSVNVLTSNVNYPNNPTTTTLITSMEGTTNLAELFGSRIAGYICAPATGYYTFWIASDDNGELWLSTDDQPSNKQRIAYHTANTSSRQWNMFATQKSAPIYLIQGETYYIEAIMKENTGGDNLAVGWLRPGQTGSVPSEVIPGSVLSPLGALNVPVTQVTLSGSSEMIIGTQLTVQSTVIPANATNNTLDWNSSNPLVASVTNSGIVTANSLGSATITATSTDGTNITGSYTVNVIPVPCSATGTISYEIWNNIGTGVAVGVLTSNVNYPYSPTSTTLITSMEGTTNLAELFGARIAGYICAPATGNYTFWIASDDNGELWLSSDDQPANKQRIAYHTANTGSRQWNNYSTQKSAPIYLVQGQSYYIEALMKENTGGDNLAVGWLKPGQTGTVPSEVIPGSVLSPLGTLNTYVGAINLQPTATVEAGSFIALSATVLPTYATNTTINWTSSNNLIATVNSDGSVSGIAPGIAVITATAADGSNISASCTVTVNPTDCVAAGNISYEVWNNIGAGVAVSILTSNVNYPNNPSSSTLITSMEGTTNLAELFGSRIAGYICAPATGFYTFWIASDDNGELWLSTNDVASNKVRIAYHTQNTNSRQWNMFATQKSSPIYLIQGESYYIEALMKENTGGDNLAVGWLKPGQTGTEPSEVIPGSVLSPLGNKSVEADNANSVLNALEVNLNVYPNPLNTDNLRIDIENLVSEANIHIYSMSGVLHYSSVIAENKTLIIDRNIFKSGVYVIKVFNTDFVKTTKLIVK